jgi:hypothetical protein
VSYRGFTAELPLGGNGLVGTRDLTVVNPGDLLQALNVTFENGLLEKEPGAQRYTPSAIDSGSLTGRYFHAKYFAAGYIHPGYFGGGGSASTTAIQGGYDWWPTETVQRQVILTSLGRLLKDEGTGLFATTLASGLQVAQVRPVFVEGGKELAANPRKLFVFTGKNPVQVLAGDGAVTTALATPPADWAGGFQPVGGVIHENRLMGFGNLNDPHRVYWSTPDNHEDFAGTGSGSQPIYQGEGERLMWGLSFKGLLILAKAPRGIYVFDTSDADVGNWKVRRLTAQIGSPGPHCGVPIDNDVVLVDSPGRFHMLSAVTEFGDLGSANLSYPRRFDTFVRKTLSIVGLANARMIYYSAKRTIYVAVPTFGHVNNTAWIAIDLNGSSPQFRYSDWLPVECLWLRKDPAGIARPMAGDLRGTVWSLDQDARNVGAGGLGYLGRVETAWIDLAGGDPKGATLVKHLQFLELLYEPQGNHAVDIEVLCDGQRSCQITVPLAAQGAILGRTFILGKVRLGRASRMRTTRRRITGSGRRVALQISNAQAGQSFALARAYVSFTTQDQRTR